MRYKMGVNARSFPQVSISTPNGIVYPFRREEHGYLKPLSLESFVKKFVANRLTPFSNDTYPLTIDNSIYERLSHCSVYNQTDLNITLKEDHEQDVLIFFYSSEIDTHAFRRSLNIASYFDTVA
jgi:hypothetical protein